MLKKILLRKHQIDKSKKIILFPARLTRWKGQLEFVDVIKKITTDGILVLFVEILKMKIIQINFVKK